jgi:hypothetical protein
VKRFALAFAALLLLALPAAAVARDRDRDRIPDRWEKRHKLSTKRSSANADTDRDRVDNWNEWREGTNPRDRDTDNDGRRDGREDRDRDGLRNAAEDATGNDPRDRDTDDDGVRDGKEHAGTVTSFNDGVLVIDTANGSSVSGLVGDFTEIRCKSEAQAERHHRKLAARLVNDGLDEDPGDEDDLGEGELDESDDLGGDNDFGEDDPFADHEDKHRCSESALGAGARVHQAKLKPTSDGLLFKRVDLLR